MWCCIAVIPALLEVEERDQKFKVTLSYCSNFTALAVIKYPKQKQLREIKAVIGFQFQIIVIIRGS